MLKQIEKQKPKSFGEGTKGIVGNKILSNIIQEFGIDLQEQKKQDKKKKRKKFLEYLSKKDSENIEDSKYGKEEDDKNARLKTDFGDGAKLMIKSTLKYIGKDGFSFVFFSCNIYYFFCIFLIGIFIYDFW